MTIPQYFKTLGLVGTAALAVFLTGCASKSGGSWSGSEPHNPFCQDPTHGHPIRATQEFKAEEPPPAPRQVTTAEPAPAPAPTGFKTSSAAFPTGDRRTSALLVEKTLPVQVLAGKEFEVVYKVSNLTDLTLQDVTVTCDHTPNFKASSATPEPSQMGANEATWNLGELAPKQTKEIRVRGRADEPGTIRGCCTASFKPVICDTILVVKPAIALEKTMPAQVVQCDPIPVKLVVKNTGSSQLTNVRVTDSLPAGLTTDAGQNTASFDAGTLAPGQSKEFSFVAKASRTGSFENPAKATSAEGVEAAARASVTVVKPALAVACTVPPDKEIEGLKFTEFFGRPFQVCWEVKNTGNAASANTVLDVAIPAGVTFRSATEGGTASGSTATWNLGSLAPGASKKVCATFVAANAGNYAFNATTKGVCADPATTSCSVVIQGINAILVEVVDDPDPIQVGEETTYTIKVTNQGGGLDLQDVTVKAVFPDGITPLAPSNNGQVSGKTVTWAPVARLPLKQTITYTVKGKATTIGDNRVEFQVTTRARQTPIVEIESTTSY